MHQLFVEFSSETVYNIQRATNQARCEFRGNRKEQQLHAKCVTSRPWRVKPLTELKEKNKGKTLFATHNLHTNTQQKDHTNTNPIQLQYKMIQYNFTDKLFMLLLHLCNDK